jgi:hypothetical protein
MSEQLPLGFEPALEQLVERLARRVVELQQAERFDAPRGEASPWMGIAKAAAWLDWPKQRLYKLSASGEIPHYKQEGRLLFHRGELESWLRRFAEGAR